MADNMASSIRRDRVFTRSQFLNLPLRSTIIRENGDPLPVEITDRILRACFPYIEVDNEGRQTIQGNAYPAFLSVQSISLLYHIFQPVFLQCNIPGFLNNVLAFGVPLKMVREEFTWPSIALQIRHGPWYRGYGVRIRWEYAITCAEYLPNVISMINGRNYGTPDGHAVRVTDKPLEAKINWVHCTFRIDDSLRSRPKYLNKLCDGLKGLRMFRELVGDSPKKVRITFSGHSRLDEPKMSLINPLIHAPKITTREANNNAQIALVEAEGLIQKRDYATSMMWLSLAANMAGCHVGHFEPYPEGFVRLVPYTIMLPLLMTFSKAARGMGNMFLACRMLERARYMAGHMLERRTGPGEQNTPDEEQIRLVVELADEFLNIPIVENYWEALSLVESLVTKYPNNERPESTKQTLISVTIDRASSMIDRGSHETLEIARKLLSPLQRYTQSLGGSPLLHKRQQYYRNKYRTNFLALLPYILHETMLLNPPKEGFLKCKAIHNSAMIEFHNASLKKKGAINRELNICFDALATLTSREYAEDVRAGNERVPPRPGSTMKPFPDRYLNEFEEAVEEGRETARGMGMGNKRVGKRKAGEEGDNGRVKFMKPLD